MESTRIFWRDKGFGDFFPLLEGAGPWMTDLT